MVYKLSYLIGKFFFVNFYHKGGPLPKKNLKFFFPKDMTIYTRIESPCSV
jgi:hypothetical protein